MAPSIPVLYVALFAPSFDPGRRRLRFYNRSAPPFLDFETSPIVFLADQSHGVVTVNWNLPEFAVTKRPEHRHYI